MDRTDDRAGNGRGALGPRLRAHARARRRWLIALLALAVVIIALRSNGRARGETVEAALGTVLARDGLVVDTGSITWIDGSPSPFGFRGAVFFASQGDDAPADLYFAAVRGTEHTVLDVASTTNVTNTPGASETGLVRIGDHVAYVAMARGAVEAVVVVDLAGEPAAATAGWSRLDRAKNAITNLQRVGRPRGLGVRRYAFVRPPTAAVLTKENDEFVVRAGTDVLALAPTRDEPVRGAELVSYEPPDKGLPGGITWLVDTVRGLSFVGPEPIAWLEYRVYKVKDFVDRMRYRYLGPDADEEDVAVQLGGHAGPTPAVSAEVQAAEAAIGFPPEPLEPIVPDPSPGEGQWVALVDDPFLATYPNAPPAMAHTHLRVDPERGFARVFIVAWDPRQVQLRAVSGTVEPQSANGATGPGAVPRDPDVLPRIIAGFNGGFQSAHGEFGMMAEGRVYLPPKPYAATVGVFDDGRVVLGSWTGFAEGERFTELAAIAQIPSGMVDFRQNLTTVVEGDRWNPWGRWYWGAAPLTVDEQSYVDRSGLCLTREGFFVYFWGQSMGPEQLGDAMKRARCERGMQLDMNAKHTAFELYDIRPASTPHPALGRPLGATEFEVPVPGATTFRARGRLLVTRMSPMRLPRYIQRDPRDFFYLTLRPTLPGPELEGLPAGAGRFSTAGLPGASFPAAFARAHLGGAADARSWAVRIDASRAVPALVDARMREHGTATLATLGCEGGSGEVALYARPRAVGFAYAVGSPPSGAVVLVAGRRLSTSDDATAALGVDRDGFLVYLERGAADPASLASRLAALGVAEAVALGGQCRLAFAGDTDGFGPGGDERSPAPSGLRFLRSERHYTDVLFPDVQPRPYSQWNRIQDTRVRYFPEAGPRRFVRPSGT